MQPKSHMTRKERVAAYGSFLFCPGQDTLCSEMDNDDGVCRKDPCYLLDPEYLKMRERIERNIQENTRREREERLKEKADPPAPIRRQTKTRAQQIEDEIRKKENRARRLYRANKPKAADGIMAEAMALRKELHRTKGA